MNFNTYDIVEMEFVQENSNVARESLEETLSSESIPEQGRLRTKNEKKISHGREPFMASIFPSC